MPIVELLDFHWDIQGHRSQSASSFCYNYFSISFSASYAKLDFSFSPLSERQQQLSFCFTIHNIHVNEDNNSQKMRDVMSFGAFSLGWCALDDVTHVRLRDWRLNAKCSRNRSNVKSLRVKNEDWLDFALSLHICLSFELESWTCGEAPQVRLKAGIKNWWENTTESIKSELLWKIWIKWQKLLKI